MAPRTPTDWRLCQKSEGARPREVAKFGPAGLCEVEGWLEMLLADARTEKGAAASLATHRPWCLRLARASTADEGWPDPEIVGPLNYELITGDMEAVRREIAALSPPQRAHCRRALVGHLYPSVADGWDYALWWFGETPPDSPTFLRPEELSELRGWYEKGLAAHPPELGCVYCDCAWEGGYE